MSRRSNEPTLNIELELRGQLAAALSAEAKRRSRPAAELLSDVIEIVIRDDLWKAVIE